MKCNLHSSTDFRTKPWSVKAGKSAEGNNKGVLQMNHCNSGPSYKTLFCLLSSRWCGDIKWYLWDLRRAQWVANNIKDWAVRQSHMICLLSWTYWGILQVKSGKSKVVGAKLVLFCQESLDLKNRHWQSLCNNLKVTGVTELNKKYAKIIISLCFHGENQQKGDFAAAVAVAGVIWVCYDQLHGPESKMRKWKLRECYRKNKFTQWLEKQLHCARCGYLAGPSVFDASRDPANDSEVSWGWENNW